MYSKGLIYCITARDAGTGTRVPAPVFAWKAALLPGNDTPAGRAELGRAGQARPQRGQAVELAPESACDFECRMC